MWRALRIGVLLFVLATVAQTAWIARSRTADWTQPLRVTIYPVNGDGRAQTGAYMAALRRDHFEPIAEYFAQEAARYGLPLAKPVEIYLAPPRAGVPPEPPRDAAGFGVLVWSLHMRYWAWRNDGYGGPRPHVRMFVLYFDPSARARVAHSVGLQKGLIGRVNAFASEEQAGPNNVVIAHELLHTFGARDKYDFATNRPVHPHGYAEPDLRPLHPQRFAEIMAGRTPLAEDRAEMPRDLSETLIGRSTAIEISWVK